MAELTGRLGSYEIDARIKSGGMGVLYLGHRVGAAGFTRHVAIKVVHPQLANDPAFVRMFVDEALLAARIDHPNVVRVEELGDSDGTYFLAMEYVHGCSLAELMRALGAIGRSLSAEMAASIATQGADGLHAAHETRGPDGSLLGVVHRDVSPHNILLSYAGHVKLIDFGIAKASTREPARAGLHGKVRYMSPEQANGAQVDRRSDVYALGIVLWEMLTGRRLFESDSELELIDRVRRPRIIRPRRLVSAVSRGLDELVVAMLEPDPSNRPQTASEVRMRLAASVPQALVIGPGQLASLIGATMPDRGATGAPASASRLVTQTPQSATPPTESLDHEPAGGKEALTRFTIPISVELPLDDASPSLTPPAPAPAPVARGASRSRVRRATVIGVAVLVVAAAAAVGSFAIFDGARDAARAPPRADAPRQTTSRGPPVTRGAPASAVAEPIAPATPAAPPAAAIASDDGTEAATATRRRRARRVARRRSRAAESATGPVNVPIIEEPP